MWHNNAPVTARFSPLLQARHNSKPIKRGKKDLLRIIILVLVGEDPHPSSMQLWVSHFFFSLCNLKLLMACTSIHDAPFWILSIASSEFRGSILLAHFVALIGFHLHLKEKKKGEPITIGKCSCLILQIMNS